MSKYLDTCEIEHVFESAGFRVKYNAYDDICVETDHKDINLEIRNQKCYAVILGPYELVTMPKDLDIKQVIMDCNEKFLKKSFSTVIRDETSITILGSEGELRILYNKNGFIHDFQCYKSRPVSLGSMGSMIGSGFDTIYNEPPICASIESNDDDDDNLSSDDNFFDGIVL